MNALESGEINAMHTSDAETVSDLRDRAEAGEVNAFESEEFGEISYIMLNESKPPFDNIKARQALAYAADFDETNAILNDGITTQATGPFAPGNIGNLDDTGFPTYDAAEAERLVQEYEEESGQPLSFTYTTTNAQVTIEQAQLLKEQAEAVGMSVEIVTVDQSTQIDTAIAATSRPSAGATTPAAIPTSSTTGGSRARPVNFGEVRATPRSTGCSTRAAPTLEGRDQIYEDLNRRFAEEVHNIWLWYTPWTVAMAADVHGVPGEGPTSAEGFPGLAAGHPVAYMWVEQ